MATKPYFSEVFFNMLQIPIFSGYKNLFSKITFLVVKILFFVVVEHCINEGTIIDIFILT
jgi:hypothetical protein